MDFPEGVQQALTLLVIALIIGSGLILKEKG
jgi:hypothetical protein